MHINTSANTNTGSNANTGINMAKKQSKCFILVWDMYGLESVVPVSEIEATMHAVEQQRLIDILSDPHLRDTHRSPGRTLNEIVGALLMRARINSQRCYEVYSIHVDSSIDADTLRTMFENDPQGSAELIRNRGSKIWCGRQTKKQLIT